MNRLVAALAILLVGCSPARHTEAAEEAVAVFRRLMESQQFAEIYATGSEELRGSTTEAELTKILGALNTKLGKVKTSEKSIWNVKLHTSGTFVTLGFNTEFEAGRGSEHFVFRIADGRAFLISYNVNSPVLLSI